MQASSQPRTAARMCRTHLQKRPGSRPKMRGRMAQLVSRLPTKNSANTCRVRLQPHQHRSRHCSGPCFCRSHVEVQHKQLAHAVQQAAVLWLSQHRSLAVLHKLCTAPRAACLPAWLPRCQSVPFTW